MSLSFCIGDIAAARDKLMDILCNYQGYRKCEVILVFDAYRVQNHKTEVMNYHNIHVVYTKEAETADCYIERFAHDFDITAFFCNLIDNWREHLARPAPSPAIYGVRAGKSVLVLEKKSFGGQIVNSPEVEN